MKIFIMAICTLWMIKATAAEPLDKCAASYDKRHADIIKITSSLEVLKEVWMKHRKCIDGASAEAYSENVGKLLDSQWDKVVSSNLIKEKDVMNALLMGVSDVWEYNLSKRVLVSAQTKCTKDAKPLCEKIIKDEEEIKRNLSK